MSTESHKDTQEKSIVNILGSETGGSPDVEGVKMNTKQSFEKIMVEEISTTSSDYEKRSVWINEFMSMPRVEQQIQVDHALNNTNTPAHGIQAAIIVLLQKSGTLYVRSMKKWEGYHIFFERLSGLRYSPNLDVVKKYKEKCEHSNESFTELGLIIFLCKTGGNMNGLDESFGTDIEKAQSQGIQKI